MVVNADVAAQDALDGDLRRHDQPAPASACCNRIGTSSKARRSWVGSISRKAPQGVCLNRAPTVRLLGKTARKGEVTIDANTTEELHLFGSVHDEGLPRGRELKIEWQVLEAPGTVTFSHPAAARTRASFTAPGKYVLQLMATDSEHVTPLRVLVTVS